MSKKTIAAFFTLLVLPATAFGAELRSGEDRLRVTDQVINENLYAAAGDVVIESKVQGDVFVGGGQVEIAGQVTGDVFVGGGNIRITGPVSGDLRIGGGNIRIENTVSGELVVGGGNVEIGEKARISGDTLIGTGQLVVAGTTGSIQTSAGSIRLAPTARVNGDLHYLSAEVAHIEEGAVVTGDTVQNVPPKPDVDKGVPAALFAGGTIIWLVTGLLALLAFAYVLPNKALALATDWKNTFWVNLLMGFIFLVVTPIAGILLLVSIIGIPFGLGVLLLYPVILYFGKLAGTLAVGVWIRSLLDKKAGIKVDWISVVVGLIVMTILGFIPAIGMLATCIVFLVGVGVLVRYDWNLFQSLRSQKKI